MTAPLARVFVWLQYLLPKHALTALCHRVARVHNRRVKDALIRGFVRLFPVDTSEAALPVPDGYASFNDFFTRELKPGARPVDDADGTLIAPADGTISEAGDVVQGRLLQAKGVYYSLEDLLATDLADAANFADGTFVTIYLAPQDYHRVHAPAGGRLTAARHVPGDLFSVNEATARRLPGLFARNERLVCHFSTAAGPLALIFVGALNVGSITTRWSGELRPRRRGVVRELDLGRSGEDLEVEKGELLGWFNMGSSVILLLPKGACELPASLRPGTRLRMGEALATRPAESQ